MSKHTSVRAGGYAYCTQHHLLHVRKTSSVEEYSTRATTVFTVQLLDVSQNILLGDYTEKSAIVSDECLAEAELPEHVDDRFHGSFIRDCDRGKVQNLPILENGPRRGRWVNRDHGGGRVVGEQYQGVGRNFLSRAISKKKEKKRNDENPWQYVNCVDVRRISYLEALIAKYRSRLKMKPTRYWLSMLTTTGKPLWSVSSMICSISPRVMES